jgi:hypothetical protein
MLEMLSGRYKRPGRPGFQMSAVVHHLITMKDARGKKVRYALAIRVDDGAPGQVGLVRLDGFLGDPKVTQVDEQPMSLDGWWLTPAVDGNFSANFAYVERITAEDQPFVSPQAKPLADFVAKTAPAAVP